MYGSHWDLAKPHLCQLRTSKPLGTRGKGMNMCAPASVSLSIPGHWLDRTSLQFPVSRAPCMSLCPPAPSHHPNSALHAQPAPHQSTLCAGALMTAAKAEKAGAQSHLGPLPLHPQTGGGGVAEYLFNLCPPLDCKFHIWSACMCVCMCVLCKIVCIFCIAKTWHSDCHILGAQWTLVE